MPNVIVQRDRKGGSWCIWARVAEFGALGHFPDLRADSCLVLSSLHSCGLRAEPGLKSLSLRAILSKNNDRNNPPAGPRVAKALQSRARTAPSIPNRPMTRLRL